MHSVIPFMEEKQISKEITFHENNVVCRLTAKNHQRPTGLKINILANLVMIDKNVEEAFICCKGKCVS